MTYETDFVLLYTAPDEDSLGVRSSSFRGKLPWTILFQHGHRRLRAHRRRNNNTSGVLCDITGENPDRGGHSSRGRGGSASGRGRGGHFVAMATSK